MKPKTVILLLTIFGLSCTSQKVATSSNKNVDPRLVGIWEGVERNQQSQELEKQWVMERTAEGKFKLNFKILHFG